jgi:transketolase
MPTRRQLANAIRALSMDAVQKANSGHPGMPMGMADAAEVLWNDFLRHNPGNPQWPDRDRFVLSNGHGSMLLYSLLYLTGYPLAIDEIKRFRQLGSHTPGHPERAPELGIETTTGPLGQGLANAVGMALAEQHLASEFNREGFPVVDHWTYCFASDGDLMEGISHEAASLAGTHRLGKLIVCYDDNGISIDGKVEGWFTDDTPARFAAYGWQVIRAVDGMDAAAVKRALQKARRERGKPSLICLKTIIGYGAPHKQGTAAAHSDAFGTEEIEAARRTLEWPYPPFEVPKEIRDGWDARARGKRAENRWQRLFAGYRTAYPELALEFERRSEHQLPKSFTDQAQAALEAVQSGGSARATRQASQAALTAFAPLLPELLGGSADLTTSNNTRLASSRELTGADPSGNYLHYGVREFGMTGLMNGMVLHGGLRPYGGTFLVFTDYTRNAIRLACLMRIPTIFVLTHDSIALGEDGPTHQPIEHLSSLRLIPHLSLWRPCDDVETHAAWIAALERRDGPTLLALTRQSVPHQARSADQLAAMRHGGYVLVESSGAPAQAAELILIATGSEVALAVEARQQLETSGRRVRVVSMPCTDRFDQAAPELRERVLPRSVPRVAIEAGATGLWWKYVGERGAVVGIDEFGASAPYKDVYPHFGFTVARVVATAQSVLAAAARGVQS